MISATASADTVIDSNLDGPDGVAVDSSGDVFITDSGDERAVEDVPNGMGGYTQRTIDGHDSTAPRLADSLKRRRSA